MTREYRSRNVDKALTKSCPADASILLQVELRSTFFYFRAEQATVGRCIVNATAYARENTNLGS